MKKSEKSKPRREGFIEPRGKNKWLIRWFKHVDSDGKQVRRSKIVKGGKREAEAELRKVLKSRDDQTYVDPSRITLNEYLDRWLESITTSVTPRTKALYAWLLKAYVRPRLGPSRLQRITTLDLQSMIAALQQDAQADAPSAEKKRGRPRKRGLSPETVRKTHRVLSQALRQAVELNLVARNVAVGVKLPKKRSTRVKSALTAEQARKLLKAAEGSRWAPFWGFLLATGCRPQEALGLRWSDLNLDGATVQLGAQVVTIDADGKITLAKEAKTEGSLRTVPLPLPTIATLRQHFKDQREEIVKAGPLWDRKADLVFPNEAGRPADLRNLSGRHFKKLATAVGAPDATIYWLRHTVATQLLAAGENPKVVAERLGHTSTQMVLDTYGHVLEGMQQSATEKLATLLYS